jgi:hypothetical protein
MIQARSVVEVETGEIQFSYVAGVIHMSEEDVHILCRAEAWQQCTTSYCQRTCSCYAHIRSKHIWA